MQFVYPHTDAEVAANAWEETTEKEYWDMLGCVPPAKRSRGAFAVGEAACHMNDGRVVYRTYIELDGKFYKKPIPIDQFNPDVFAAEIRKQLSEEGDAKHWYCEGGAGFILYRGRQAIWETVTFLDMRKYMNDHELRDVDWRQTNILFVR